MPEERNSQPSPDETLTRLTLDAATSRSEHVGFDQLNFVKEALKWQYNWIGLAGAAAFALVSGTGLPLVLAVGLELIYLSVVPQTSRFRRLVRSWKYAEEKRNREMTLTALFHELPPEMRKRYAQLETWCLDISANYARLSSTSQVFVQQMEERLQGLLQSYVRLLSAAYHHAQYLGTLDPSRIQREVAELQRASPSEGPKVQEINRKRVEILTKRLEKFEKIRENRQVINAQCGAIEDVLALIRDQSVTLRDPQEVNIQLESVLNDVEQTEVAVREVEAIFDLASPELTGIPPLPTGPATTGTQGTRSRVRN
jgi:hypothetical protein